MLLGKIIKQYREENGISQRQFARMCGLSNGYISLLEKNENPVTGDAIKPSLVVFQAVAAAMGISVEQLLGKAEDFSGPRTQLRPLLGAIVCRDPVFTEQNFNGMVPVPENIPCDFVLQHKGDSMIGVHITDGAMVYLRKQSYAENGQIVAVLIDGVATLKRICKSENSLTLLSENPAYSPIVLTGESSESAHILGVAVAYTNYLIK